MKVAVYAICLNEAAHVERFMSTASEADYVVVADTGSTDGTVELLREHGAIVHEIRIKPWRFDDARNAALALVPADADVCVVVDLDEVLDAGWCEDLKSKWEVGVTTRGRYFYVWNHNADGSPGVSFWADRLHARHGFRWVHPCHETVVPDRTEEVFTTVGYQLHHWADETKSRGQYLPLLELAAKERPDDPRTAHYLGREFVFNRVWDKAEVELLRHLSLPASTWKPERAKSMRLLSEVCSATGRVEEALMWARRATQEAPELREGWVLYAQVCHNMGLWDACLAAATQAISISERPPSYMTEQWAWGSAAFDLGSIAAWNLGAHDMARDLCATASEMSPDDERIAANLRFFESAVAG
jgi:hypothetical protein